MQYRAVFSSNQMLLQAHHNNQAQPQMLPEMFPCPAACFQPLQQQMPRMTSQASVQQATPPCHHQQLQQP
jgi:hypothetical protein